MPPFDLPGSLRRVRRLADLSQRDLARAVGISKSAVAAAETGQSGLDIRLFARAAELAGLRLAVVDAAGAEVTGMSGAAVRDRAGRFFPAHLDPRYGDDRWWHGPERYSRPQPSYTFDRDRSARDADRRRHGTPDDHRLPQPGDSPAERAEARARAAWERREEKIRRRLLDGDLPPEILPWTCTCPPLCDELDDRTAKPVHAPECACLCDVA